MHPTRWLLLLATVAFLLGTQAAAQDTVRDPDPASAQTAQPEQPEEPEPPDQREVPGETASTDEPEQAGETEARRPPPSIDEIVITAEKREGLLQDTPAAISAFDTERLEIAGFDNFEELSFNVPNLFFSRTGPGVNIAIRGVSALGGDPAATFHVDGNYQADNIIPGQLTFFDIERVEVLRGPQGTLYGRNSTGGAINVITRKPVYDLEAYGDIQFGNFNQIFSRAAVNFPLIEDTLATRFSFFQELRDGYTRRRSPTEDKPVDSLVRRNDPNDGRSWGFRGQLRTSPTEDMDWIVRGFYAKIFGAGPAFKQLGPYPEAVDLGLTSADIFAGASPNPKSEFKIRTNRASDIDVLSWGVNTHFEHDFYDIRGLGDSKLELNASFVDRDFFNGVDSDSSDAPLVTNETDTDSREWVVDAHFASDGPGIEFDIRDTSFRLDWLVGAFYLGTRGDTQILAPSMVPLGSVVAETTADLNRDRESDSAAFYTQSTLWMNDEWSLTLGGRFNWDRKELDQFDKEINLGGIICVVPEIKAVEEKTWKRGSGVVKLNWDPTPDNLVYFSWTPGYKSGEINTEIPSSRVNCMTVDEPNADPERIFAYEIGSKNRFLDNRLQANMTFFYYDYDDLQVQQQVEATTVTTNAAEARVFGLEGEFVAVPIDNLTFTLNVTYLNTQFEDFIGFLVENTPGETCQRNPDQPECLDFSGQDMLRSPKYTTFMSLQYFWDLGRYGKFIPYAQIYLSDDVKYRPGSSSQLRNARLSQAPPGTDPDSVFIDSGKQDNYLLLNLRTTWRSPNEQIYIEGFVNNVTDRVVANNKIAGSALLGTPILTFFDQPRTYGARIGFNW